MTEDGVLLRPQGICKRFGGVLAVDQFSGVVRENHLVGIIGPNGAGKTTILNLLSGIYAIDSGEVVFQGKAIGGLQSFEIGRRGIARGGDGAGRSP